MNNEDYIMNKNTPPSRFSIIEDNKELKHRFEKRQRKRLIARDRDTKYMNLYLQDDDKETETYVAWEEHIKFLKNQKF
jgi:hypothetical protein|tara:strand:- start:251 stop:484 length:234 start_codon:yes stop_codon:yes gene_type:complete